jgi:hypothetical protein
VDNLSLNELYTIKLFFTQWGKDFERDIIIISNLKADGAKCDTKLYKALGKRFEPLLGTRRVSESVSYQKAFKTHIDRKFIHDDLHEHFAHYSTPLYKTILTPAKNVYTSKKLFMGLSDDDKFKCALEEIYTVATERLIIPYGYNLQDAKAIALKRLCVGLTKGYFNIYLLENYFDLLYSDNWYFERKLNQLGKYE